MKPEATAAPQAPSQLRVRVDKWLWAVRVFKTRSLATEACKAGHVKIDGTNVKASREVKVAEVIVARAGELTRTVKVIGLIERRVGAKLVANFMEDLTPESEYERRREARAQPFFHRPRGFGRPTKRDRRELNRLNQKVKEAPDDED